MDDQQQNKTHRHISDIFIYLLKMALLLPQPDYFLVILDSCFNNTN